MSNPQDILREFLDKLNSVVRSETNPNGVIAETVAANLGVPVGTVRHWIYNENYPKPYLCELLMPKLDMLVSLRKASPNPKT